MESTSHSIFHRNCSRRGFSKTTTNCSSKFISSNCNISSSCNNNNNSPLPHNIRSINRAIRPRLHLNFRSIWG